MTSTSIEQQQQFILYYWPIRGLGSPCRAALTFNNIAFKDVRMRDWAEKGGTRDKLHNDHNLPLANLPALVVPCTTNNNNDDDIDDGSSSPLTSSSFALTQTATILRYIGSLRGAETKPRNDLDAAQISMVIDHLLELHTERVKATYGPDALENVPSLFSASVPYYFGTLEEWMTNRKTSFVATNHLSVADIFLTEFIQAFSKLKKSFDWMEKFPKLFEVYQKVVEHPKLKGYYEQEKETPFNNPVTGKWS